VAGVIDSLVLGVAWLIFSFASRKNPIQFPALLDYSSAALLVLLCFIYYFAFEGLFSSTVGKSLVGLMVLEKDGDVCSFQASFRRNLLRFVDWLPFLYILGAIAVVMSTKRQRIGDRVAGTIVTKAPEKDLNPPPAPFLFH
jgi:uncharacterized RDD family membrane protein YckC